jgi:hypothetical protein
VRPGERDSHRSKEDRLSVRLIEHIRDPEKRREVMGQYSATKYILDETLRRVVQKKLDASIKASEDPEKYKSANWRDQDADQFGYRRALREILDLLP